MELILQTLSYNLENISSAASELWALAGDVRIIAFSGEMGAGKTTFIHALCQHLEVEDHVSSPTFALINEYHFRQAGLDQTMYHMDWYRLNNEAEAINAGLEDCLAQAYAGKAWCLVEWPERAGALLHAPCLWLTIESTSPYDRVMTVTKRMP